MLCCFALFVCLTLLASFLSSLIKNMYICACVHILQIGALKSPDPGPLGGGGGVGSEVGRLEGNIIQQIDVM